jgi:hypothetical protein
MTPFRVGMKVYDNDWFLKYNFSYEEAARILRDWGVTFILAQSRYLPMPDTAVKSEVPPELAKRYAAYDDRRFRDALAKEGVEYWAAATMFFDPAALAANPGLRAVGSDGEPIEKIDWYIGIPPSMQQLVDHKVAAIEKAVEALEPDGVFLAFMRWPNFWELWMPRHRRQDFLEYSYDAMTLARFEQEAGVDLSGRQAAQAAQWIEENAREAWTDWKCGVVEDVIRQVRTASQRIKPDTRIMLNTVPFGADDYDGAQEKVFGQRFETLADVVDVFEVMTYHQILKRPTDWIPQIGSEVKARSGCKTVCTLQAAPLYLEGMHAAEDRSPTLDVEEFGRAVQSVAAAQDVDGVVVFLWSDFLDQVYHHNDSRRVDILRAAAASRAVS